MVTHNFVDHTGSDGSDVTVRMRRTGYAPLYWGEIIAWAPGGADGAFDGWWNSPHHHDIMLGGQFNEMGGAWQHDPRSDFSYFVFAFGRRK
jgi:uncharacterized protein YkwD